MAYQTVKSVEKALAILELLIMRTAENKILTLADVAKNTGILPVTARNLLRTLENCGYVQRRAHGQYEEGERCYSLLLAGGIIRKLREIARPIIERASIDMGESLLLTTILNGKRREIFRLQSPDDKMEDPCWSANEDVYRMRTGRVMIAWFSPEQLSFFVERNGLPSRNDWPECEENMEGLERELRTIRRRGGCNDRTGTYAAIAVPILTGSNQIVATLGCYSPLLRTDLPRAAGLFKMLQDSADLIRAQLS